MYKTFLSKSTFGVADDDLSIGTSESVFTQFMMENTEHSDASTSYVRCMGAPGTKHTCTYDMYNVTTPPLSVPLNSDLFMGGTRDKHTCTYDMYNVTTPPLSVPLNFEL